MGEQKTPVWCERCRMWVPAEREPHMHPDDRELHYALGSPTATAAAIARAKRDARRGG